MQSIKNLYNKFRWGWKWTVPGGVLIIAGVYFLMLWGQSKSVFLALAFVFCLVGGIYFMRHGIQEAFQPVSSSDKREKEGGPPPNSLNIYIDKFDFEYVEKPLGMKQRYLNDGQEYYVHEVDPIDGTFKEWRLPDNNEDERYYDPTEFADVVTMPCCKKYLEWQPTTFQKVAFGIMGFIIGIEMLVLVMLAG